MADKEKNRTIFHIDANSAFLSWQAAYDLQHGAAVDYREVPSVIGGNQATRHGIVLAKSIKCRPYGIQTGEPVVSALKKCPKLLVIPPDYFIYMRSSQAMFQLLSEYSPRMQVFSVDEGFLDYTGMEQMYGEDPVAAACIIKERIKQELGFTVSVGISSNKLLAKMASEFKKPDGVAACYPEEIKEKLWPLPVRELFGVGRATEEKLLKYEMRTIGDIANANPDFLKHIFKSYGQVLWEFSNGNESSAVHQGYIGGNHETVKGVGNSCTSYFDITDRNEAHLTLLSLIETVAVRLRLGGFAARAISVILRKNDLDSYSHQCKLMSPVDTVEAIYCTSKQLFDDAWKGEPLRGLGVRVTDFYSKGVQLNLFEKDWSKERAINCAVDEIRFKYGKDAIMRGAFLWSGIKHMQGGLSDVQQATMSSML